MKRIERVDVSLFVSDSDAVLADEQEFRMRNGELLAVSRANGKGAKTAAQPFFQFLHVHMVIL